MKRLTEKNNKSQVKSYGRVEADASGIWHLARECFIF